ncbi:hypothetical protein [Rhodanobacter sp. PCA2]|uniref:hypothetical protein n=1 Tax=Rhodanobacter sp. PCA2 TaxID=2006117 RepID=UPI0015E73C19|nr:hypothetical protein [Rhodanobacter sp. PCA2]
MYGVDVELRVRGRVIALRNDGLLPKDKWIGRNWSGCGDRASSTTWHLRSWTLWHQPPADDGDHTSGFMLCLGWFRLGLGRVYQFAV